MFIPAHVKYIVLSLLFTIATVNFARTTLSIVESSKRLDALKNEVSALEETKVALERELDFKSTDSFIEEEARNKLNLIKPGEEVFVMPVDKSSRTITSQVLSATTEVDSVGTQSNFKKWVELFF